MHCNAGTAYLLVTSKIISVRLFIRYIFGLPIHLMPLLKWISISRLLVCTVLYTLHSALPCTTQCKKCTALYNIHSALHCTASCTVLYNVYSALHCTMYTVHCNAALHNMHSILHCSTYYNALQNIKIFQRFMFSVNQHFHYC